MLDELAMDIFLEMLRVSLNWECQAGLLIFITDVSFLHYIPYSKFSNLEAFHPKMMIVYTSCWDKLLLQVITTQTKLSKNYWIWKQSWWQHQQHFLWSTCQIQFQEVLLCHFLLRSLPVCAPIYQRDKAGEYDICSKMFGCKEDTFWVWFIWSIQNNSSNCNAHLMILKMFREIQELLYP